MPTAGTLAHSASLPIVASLLVAIGLLPGQPAPAADRMTPVDVRQVKLGGEIGRRIDVTVHNNLLVLDADGDFLRPFAERNRDGGYVGLGKLIDAAVRLAAYTGDDQVLALKRHLVEKAIQAQQPDGYLGMMKPEKRLWTLWDIHEMGYLVLGLTADHQFFAEEKSLAAAKRLADYIVRGWSANPQAKPGHGQITVHMAVTGLESAMLALYQASGDRRYLDFCVKQRKLPQWKARIVTGRWGPIEGHAYAHICRCVAQLRLDRIQPDPRLTAPAHEVVDFLTRRDGLVITGACGDHECWHDTQTGTINLGETCATAYLIRLMDELLRREGQTLYGDIMERAIYNTLFAAQSPDGRRIRYYTPFDGPRQYFEGDTYCCPNNYRRIIAELPGMVVYRADGGAAVNLYTAGTVTLPLDDGATVEIRQQTDYPHSGRVRLFVEPSVEKTFPLALRIPRWAAGAKVSLNGAAAAGDVRPGTWFRLDRAWRSGDRVDLEMPMPWRLVRGRKAQAGCVAVMRGPLVFTLNRGRNKGLDDVDLRLVTIDPATLEGPREDDSVHPGGLACRVRAWGPGKWYPAAPRDLDLVLTEFADPGGEAAYFHVPNPNAKAFVADELVIGE